MSLRVFDKCLTPMLFLDDFMKPSPRHFQGHPEALHCGGGKCSTVRSDCNHKIGVESCIPGNRDTITVS
jgi:hypothetical protein